MQKETTGWGLYPKIKAEHITPDTIENLREALENLIIKKNTIIPRGMGRSYGDSSLSKIIIDTTNLNLFKDFDATNGILTCFAGVTIKDILKYFVKKGWFIPVTPGTKYVTIGGAIASDVHGKNHHKDGTFSAFILEIKLLTAENEIITCSKDKNQEIFYATCGGMGLTGIIIEAKIQLVPIKSFGISQKIISTNSLEEIIDNLDKYQAEKYTVAWLDFLNIKENLDKIQGLVLIGNESKNPKFDIENIADFSFDRKIIIPYTFPDFTLNKYSMKAYNFWHYYKNSKLKTPHDINYNAFFYPLDNLKNWNYLYGKKGFLQYQFVIPKNEDSIKNLKNIFSFIKNENKHPYLIVFKLFGNENNNYLSFPLHGYTVTLDFKIDNGIFEFLDKLDLKILNFNGRIYLTKDARMKKQVFQESYKNFEKFLEIKKKIDPKFLFSSLQFERLFL